MNNQVLVLGGAGFVGSNIAKKFFENGYHVTVIDGLLSQTGGRKENIQALLPELTFVHARVEDYKELGNTISRHDLIIDCMAWTAHKEALRYPEYDLQLNVLSHLHFIQSLLHISKTDRKIIYLASRGQYGRVSGTEIHETTPMHPVDIQGVHKLTSESYYRIYSELNNLNVISLRFPNCFGINQPFLTEDIGLVGGFIIDLLQDKTIEIFGAGRKRNLVYASDIAEIVFQLSQQSFKGFNPINAAGHQISIENLVIRLREIIQRGQYKFTPMPKKIKKIDMGNLPIAEHCLREHIGEVLKTDLHEALSATVEYFKKVVVE